MSGSERKALMLMMTETNYHPTWDEKVILVREKNVPRINS